MKKTFLLTILTFLFLDMNAQRPGNRGEGPGGQTTPLKITGKVVDSETSVGLEFATISLFSRRDSSLITGAMTGPDGTFEITTRPGAFFAKAEYIAYEVYTWNIPIDRDAIREGNNNIDLGEVKLYAAGIELAEVEIRGEKSEVQFSLDKRVFNVGKDLANQGGSAQDILDNVPSVTVDIEGNVSLRGSSGVRMLIDGRPSGLLGADNANGLRSIPANLIDRVEVITNPSARYEAEGMAGIINIVLKKQTGSGFNGSFDVNGGYPESAGVGANINYRKGDLNWFANYGLRYRSSPGGGFSYQESTFGEELFIQEQDQDRNRTGLSNSVRLGIDYYLKEKETLTGSLLFRRSEEDNLATIIYKDYLQSFPTNLTGITTRTDDEKEDETNFEYSINYRKEFSNRDHELKATVQYRDNTESQGSDFLEVAEILQGSPKPDLIQRSVNQEGQNSWLLQFDFSRPLGKDHKYETGLRSSIREIDNDYLVEEMRDGSFVNLVGLSNNFRYDEYVHAAYFIYGNKFKKFSFQAGIRGEYSDVITELIQTSEINDRDYINFFPSAHLNYELPGNNAVQVSYSRRLRRPRFWDLNPFFTFSDSRNTFSGNPNLDPELTDSYEIGHIKYWDKGTISGSFFYRHTTDAIERILIFNPDGTTNRQPQNLATQDDYGLELTFSYSGLEWLRLDGNANFFRSQTNGQNVDASFQADALTWFSRLTSRMTLWNNSDLQLRFNYRGPRETTQGRTNGIASLDLGWSMDVMNKQATLTLSVRDLFNSRKRAGETIGEGFYRVSEFQWRARSFNLNFNYRINQRKQRQRRGEREEGDGEFEGQF